MPTPTIPTEQAAPSSLDDMNSIFKDNGDDESDDNNGNGNGDGDGDDDDNND